MRLPRYRWKHRVSPSLSESWPSIIARLRSLTAREPIAALNRDGFNFVRQVGSHQRYAHTDGRRVTVAPHGSGDTFTIKTLKSMIERHYLAEIEEEDDAKDDQVQ